MTPGARQLRARATEAVLYTLRARGLTARTLDLPEGDEVEVLCAPRIPVRGARFFLRVEAVPLRACKGGRPPEVPVASRLLAAWRVVPEPVAVVAVDPSTGRGRLGEVHPFLPRLDRERPRWERAATVPVPLPEDLDGPALPRLAREAADAMVLFRRILEEVRAPARERGARDWDLELTFACVDLLRETGAIEEAPDRTLRPTAAVAAAFARAAAHHGLGARGVSDPALAAEAGRSAVVRVLMARLPAAAESTAARCARLLCRFLPVEDTDALLALAEGEGPPGGDDE